MADNSLRYRTNPVFPRSSPSSDADAFEPGHAPGNGPMSVGNDDPLAELARLVGEADPFDDRRTAVRPSRDPWEAEGRSDPATHHLHAPPLADYSYGDEGEARGENWQGSEQAGYNEPQAQGVYYAEDGRVAGPEQYADDQYADDQYVEERYADEQNPDEQYADEQYADDGYAQYERQGNSPPARRGKLVTVGLVRFARSLAAGHRRRPLSSKRIRRRPRLRRLRVMRLAASRSSIGSAIAVKTSAWFRAKSNRSTSSSPRRKGRQQRVAGPCRKVRHRHPRDSGRRP